MSSSKEIIFTGGGTGGHIYPGLAVIEELKTMGLINQQNYLWIGSGNPLEKQILQRFQVPFRSIPSGKLRRYFSLLNFLDLFKIFGGFVAAFFLLIRYRPKVLFSKGGFVSVPPVVAASILRIPVITHESDRDPGLATKLNSRFADRILVSYKDTKAAFSKTKQHQIKIVGNPVRKEVLEGNRDRAYKSFGLDPNRPMVFVVGGSQGAAQINDLIAEILDPLLVKAQVVHQMGAKTFQAVDRPGYINADFFQEEYTDLLAAADVVVSRAGASSLWEIAAAGKPSILIPLSRGASRGDQIRNSRIFSDLGAALVLEGDTATADALLKGLTDILDHPETHKTMAGAALSLGARDSARNIAVETSCFLSGRALEEAE